MSTMNFSVIGAGRLGKTLTFSLLKSNLIELKDLCNATFTSSQATTKLLGAGRPIKSLTELEPCDLLWITVPDDQIASIATELAKKKILKPGTIVIHCSGVLSSAILNPLVKLRCYTASMHPFRAFSNDPLNRTAFRGCYCALEGAPEAINTLAPLFKTLGASLIPIQASQKPIYHAAAAIASNYLVTLAAAGTKLLEEAGIDAQRAKSMIHQIMQASLNAVEKADTPAQALTGPLARGDMRTIKQHLDAINDGTIHQLYCAAALATLPLTQLEAKQLEEIRGLVR